jgi:probable rRNA maturation factor
MSSIEIRAEDVEEPPSRALCRRFLARVLQRRGLGNWELSVLFTGDERIRELNRRYRGRDTATDVLCFSQDGSPALGGAGQRAGAGNGEAPRWLAGDVVVSLQSVRRNARENGVGEQEELKRVLIHGILHLEGMDHEEPEAGATVVASADTASATVVASADTASATVVAGADTASAGTAAMIRIQEDLLNAFAEERVF